MATIVRDVPGVTLDLEACVVGDYDRDAVLEMFRELEFRSLVSRLPDHVTDAPGPQAAVERAPSEDRAYEVVDDRGPSRRGGARESGAQAASATRSSPTTPHPMRAADGLVGIGLSTQAASGWYVPFGHTDAPLAPPRGSRSSR